MTKKILIVDDEADMRDMLESSFNRNGYSVITAANGKEAIEKVNQNTDIILLDINLPDMDGLAVCSKIRDRTSCPILFLTARDTDADKVLGLKTGGDDYVIKPFSLIELGARVDAHLRRENRRIQQPIRVWTDGDFVIDYFIPRYTRVVDTSETKENIGKAYTLISESKIRNEMIISDVEACIEKGRTPVILTRFKEQAKLLYDNLLSAADHVFLLYGNNTDKENAEIRNHLKEIPENESLILVATGQKIGEGFDFLRLDVLILAAPVSYEGRLEQYVGRLNRDYEGKEAVFVYDYIDSHVRYFDRMYAKRLRTYKKLGFSICEGESKEKQITHAIFDSEDYTEKFDQDLVEAEKSIVISSPGISQNRIDRLLSLTKERQEAGVRITVITTDPEEVTYGNVNACFELIDRMRKIGIDVITKTEIAEHFAVIDDELVWHGGMNLLGKMDVWDNLMRIRDHQVAAELLEMEIGMCGTGAVLNVYDNY